MAKPEYLETTHGSRLAYCHSPGGSPGVVFCTGFHSDMQGEKALALEAWCVDAGRQFTRFDYFGHGASEGVAAAGRIGRWSEDTLAILDEVVSGPQLLVGSSMGAWMALLAALARPEIAVALVGVASAPDFTRWMREHILNSDAHAEFERCGFYDMPSHYPGESSYRIEAGFLDEAESHCLLDAPIALDIPVRLLHGQADTDVPWQHSLAIAEAITGSDIKVELIKGGDHRLSRPADIRSLLAAVSATLACLTDP